MPQKLQNAALSTALHRLKSQYDEALEEMSRFQGALKWAQAEFSRFRFGSSHSSLTARIQDSIRNAFEPSALPVPEKAFIDEVERVMDKRRAAADHPHGPKSKPWLRLDDMSLSDALLFAAYLPDPRRRRGRPRGKGRVVENTALLNEMEALIAEGAKPTTAAREVLRVHGKTVGVKHRADYLVKLFRDRTDAE